MKIYCFWVLVSMAIVLVLISFSSSRAIPSLPDTLLFVRHAGRVTTRLTERKLKEMMRHNEGGGDVNVQDYNPIDPSPSSKATIKPAPIEHASPLLPHIPKPSPCPPNNGIAG